MNESKNIFKEGVTVKNLDELGVFAGIFLKKLEDLVLSADGSSRSKLVGLSGDLGAGKTTFSKAAAKELGIQEVVTSPTFGIQKQYKVLSPKYSEIFNEFVHIDAYRIEDIKETESLRFSELFQKPNTLIFIEWPEKIAEILPKDTIVLSFESIDENTRKISY